MDSVGYLLWGALGGGIAQGVANFRLLVDTREKRPFRRGGDNKNLWPDEWSDPRFPVFLAGWILGGAGASWLNSLAAEFDPLIAIEVGAVGPLFLERFLGALREKFKTMGSVNEPGPPLDPPLSTE